MTFKELIEILKRIYKEYIKLHLTKIFIALALSIIVAGSTSGIAWLLDPAVKKIFIDKDPTFAWLIPILIIVSFSSKGLSLYFARTIIIRVGEEVAGKLKKQLANNILVSDTQTQVTTNAANGTLFSPISGSDVQQMSLQQTVKKRGRPKNIGDYNDRLLYDLSLKYVTTCKEITVADIQRRFQVGYRRARMVMERLEVDRIVSEKSTKGSRQVLTQSPSNRISY